VEHKKEDETSDSMLDDSNESEKNRWLKQEHAAAKTKALLKQR